MDINQLLRGVDCTCGKKHTCAIKSVYIEENALWHMGEICRDEQNILLVADENTFAAAGEKTLAALAGKNLQKVVFDGKEILVPNEQAIDAVSQCLQGIEMIVGVGSGVIQDLCKYVAFANKLPYVIVATAPSMDGYASDGAAMILGGMKVTVAAALPRAIVADTDVLKNAPFEMIQAGYGDIVGKFSALNDWKLSHLVNGEYFCQYIYDLTFEQVKKTLDLADGIVKRDSQSIQTLMEALVVVGILMSFAGSSRPASGSEHHLSHFFEITGIIDGTPYFPHGIDVAYSTVITAAIREKLANAPFKNSGFRPEKQAYQKRMKEIYKEVAEGCIALQEKVGSYACDKAEVYLAKQEKIKEILLEMPSAREIEQMLGAVGLDMAEFYKLYSDEKIENAVLYAKELKDRYTVLWLNYHLYGKA